MMNQLGNNYEKILGLLLEGPEEDRLEALRRLCTLSAADRRQFSLYSRKICALLEPLLRYDGGYETITVTLSLTGALITQAPKEVEAQVRTRLLPLLIALLGHRDPNIRKSAHNTLLLAVRTFRCFEQALGLYGKVGFQYQDVQARQKSVNSLQSLIIMETKQLNMGSEDFKKVFARLLTFAEREEIAVRKAAEQCLTTICKLPQVIQFAKGLDTELMNRFRSFFYRLKDMGVFTEDIAIEEEKAERKFYEKDVKDRLKLSVAVLPEPQVLVVAPKEDPAQLSGLALKQSMELILSEKDLKRRLGSVEQLYQKIMKEKGRPQFQVHAKTLYPLAVKLISDPNFKISLLAVKIIEVILENRSMKPLADASLPEFIEKLGDSKLSVRQAVFRILKSDFMRQPKNHFIEQLLSSMRKSANPSLKEEILNLLTQVFSEESLSPSLVEKALAELIPVLDDQRTKLKIKALDCLAALATRSDAACEQCKRYLEGRINKIYYEMFLEKVQKLMPAHPVHAKQASLPLHRPEETNRKTSTSIGSIAPNARYESIRKAKDTRVYDSDVDRFSEAPKRKDGDQLVLPAINKSVFLKGNQSEGLGTPNPPRAKVDLLVATSTSAHSKSFKYQRNLEVQSVSQNSLPVTTRAQPLKVKSFIQDYKSTEPIKTSSESPQAEIKSITGDLKSQDWQRNFNGLISLKEVLGSRPHILTHPVVKILVFEVTRIAESLRSSLAKNALLTITQMAKSLHRLMDGETDLIMSRLLKRTLDANNFICEEVRKALQSVCDNGPEGLVMNNLVSFHGSKSLAIKLCICSLLEMICRNPRYIPKEQEKILRILNDFMGEGCSQIRNKAKAMLLDLIARGFKDAVKRMVSEEHQRKLFANVPRLVGESHESPPASPERYEEEKLEELSKPEVKPDEPTRRSKIMVIGLPQELNALEEHCGEMVDSNAKSRLAGVRGGLELVEKYKESFYLHRSFIKYFDLLNKMLNDPNSPVQRAATQALLRVIALCPRDSLTSFQNIILTDLVSMLLKEGADEVFECFLDKVGGTSLGPYLVNGANFAVPKLKVAIVLKLERHLDKFLSKASFQKPLTGLIIRLAEEGRPEIQHALSGLARKAVGMLGPEAFGAKKDFIERLL